MAFGGPWGASPGLRCEGGWGCFWLCLASFGEQELRFASTPDPHFLKIWRLSCLLAQVFVTQGFTSCSIVRGGLAVLPHRSQSAGIRDQGSGAASPALPQQPLGWAPLSAPRSPSIPPFPNPLQPLSVAFSDGNSAWSEGGKREGGLGEGGGARWWPGHGEPPLSQCHRGWHVGTQRDRRGKGPVAEMGSRPFSRGR